LISVLGDYGHCTALAQSSKDEDGSMIISKAKDKQLQSPVSPMISLRVISS
jgi:hypothetical protein